VQGHVPRPGQRAPPYAVHVTGRWPTSVCLSSLLTRISLSSYFYYTDPATIQRQVASIESRLFDTYYAVNNDRYYL
jgi:hypothetical protein